MELNIPRDRNNEFEPQIIPKYQREITGIEGQIIALYAKGMSNRDIEDHLKNIYGIEVSATMISFYKYREALYLHDALSLLIYFFVIFGDVFLSRVKKFVNGNAFVLATISFSVFIIISKFYIDITYVSQCSMLALCFMAILFNKEGKEYKNILHNLIHTFLIMIVFIFVFFVLGGTFSYKLSTLSLNTEEVNEVLLQEHIKELNEELE